MRNKCSLLFFLLILLASNLWAQVDFRKETIYFLLTSRFYDGDNSNNRPNEWCSYIPGITNPNITNPQDVTWRGDFKGLIEKLGYIKDLGFTAIWINPVVQGRSPLDYHGYHAWDFTKVDTRLESPGAGFKDLIEAAHAKGIKVILDIVTNHSGRYGIKGVSELKYNTDPTKPWGQNALGQPLADNPNWEYDGSTPNPDDNKLWSRANLAKMPSPYNQNLANYNWPSTQSFVNTSDPNFFHHWGNGFVQGWDDTSNCYNGAISDDCPDLNTGSQAVQDYFFNAYKQYIDWGVDAFRWDTYKHMNKQDIQALLDRFKAYKPDLFVFGEVAQKRFELHPVQELNPHWYTWRGAVGSSGPSGSSVLDFYAEATFHNIFENGGGFSGVTDAARYDHLYQDPSQLVTWLDNHDFGPNNDWNRRYSGSDENLAACMNFMFTWRGIPSVYYGTESRFKSGVYTDLHDAAGIQKSIDETGRAYYGEAMANAPSHIIYKHIRKLNAIRKAVPALQNGSWQWAGNAPWNGIGYTRTSGASFVCVGLAKDGSAGFNFTGISNGIYRDAVTGREYTVSNGNLSFNVTSGSAGIYVKDGPGMIGESGAGFFEPCVTGCNNTPPTVTISPVGSNYSSAQTVTITAAGIAAPYTIYYTTDGSNPTTASPVYTAPFQINSTTIVKAIAKDASNRISEIQAERYSFVIPPPVISISPVSGNYYNPVNATITASGGTAPYTIYYTTDGSDPTTASAVYSAPVNLSGATVLKAMARDAVDSSSSIVTRNYTFNIPAPVVSASPAGGNFNTGNVSVTLAAVSPRPPVTIYYTTDNSIPSAVNGNVYTNPVNLTGGDPDTLKFMGIDAEGRASAVYSSIYTYYPIPDITVYFKRPANWANTIKIHYWNALPAGVYSSTTWPGVAMTPECGDWYKFTFSGITSTSIVFNDGNGKQTANLQATQTAYYDNGWLASVPDLYAPVANFTVSPGTSGQAPFTVTFNGSTSTACAGITSYAWDFGNGQNNTGQAPSTTYSSAGTYQATLTITDQQGATSTKTQSISVTNAAAGFWVYFIKPASWSNNVRIHYWNKMPGSLNTTWPGVAMTAHCGNIYKYFFSNCTNTNIIFNDDAGKQTVELAVHREITFDNGNTIFGAPANNESFFVNFEMTPATGINPLSVNFTASTLINCNNDPLSYAWNFGDGANSSSPNPTHIYTVPGKYTVSLSVTGSGPVPNAGIINKTIYVGQSGNPVKLHYRKLSTWAASPYCYFWNPQPATANTAWPGQQMANEGNGWWLYEIPAAQCANIIFSNNGNPQTQDLLNVCGEAWYDNGWISNIAPGTPLPAHLLSFRGSQEKAYQNKLHFSTVNEFNVTWYELERSTDAATFTPVARIPAKNGQQNEYSHTDNLTAFAENWYYRLRITDADGSFRFSNIIRIIQDNALYISITPNPVTDEILVKVPPGFMNSTNFQLTDAAGKTILHKRITQSGFTVARQKSWAAGTYLASIKDKNGHLLHRQKLLFW